jgi:membrane-bound metal-dependent hydrolase YbcI (DUF457 family)
MDSRSHLVVSAAVGLPLAVAFSPASHPAVPLAVAVAVGVGIDADHFLLARYNTGGWAALRRVVADPRIAVFDQSAIFETGDVWAFQRLLSHVLIGTVLVPALWLLARPVGVTAAASLYAHLLADLVADARSEREYVRQRAGVLDDGE